MSERSRDRRTFLSESLFGVGALGTGAFVGRGAGTDPLGRIATGSLTEHAATMTGRSDAEARIRELGLRFPPIDEQQGAIVPAVQVGNLLFVSGHGPRGEDGQYIVGKVGTGGLTVEQGTAAARACAMTMLAALRPQLGGNLDRITRVVKALGMVNSMPDFTQQPAVVNGFSNALIEIWGDRGRAARSAVGVAALPQNWAVEVEAIFEITPA
jgi:enamine deaminase RidA (YjgF/YER057c/UK114 family)